MVNGRRRGEVCGWLVTRDVVLVVAIHVVCPKRDARVLRRRCPESKIVIFQFFLFIFFLFVEFSEARTVSWIVFIICCATRNVMAAPVQRHKSSNSPTPSTMDDETATDLDPNVESEDVPVHLEGNDSIWIQSDEWGEQRFILSCRRW